VYVSGTPPSVSALTLLPKNNCQFPKNSGVIFGVGVLQVRRPNYAPTLKKRSGQRIFVSADNINVSARLATDFFIKNWVGQLHAAEPKAAQSSKKILPSRFSLVFVSATPPSVSALTLLPKKIVNSRKIQMCFLGSAYYMCADPVTLRP